MKYLSFPVLLFALIVIGCAHGNYSTSPAVPAATQGIQKAAIPSGGESVAPSATATTPESASVGGGNSYGVLVALAQTPAPSEKDGIKPAPAAPAGAERRSAVGGEYGDYSEEGPSEEEEKTAIADPLEPFNRAMFQFNDKLYFWVLKPVAQAYSKAVPESARISVRNFFSNLSFPIRFINCLLQADPGCAATEVGRFGMNTIWGIGGFLDPASSKDINLAKQNRDFGQTLGVYGLGQGFYVDWPILGPSSARDTIGLVGDAFSYPPTYFNPWDVWAGARVYDKVNSVSLSIGDYESLIEAAIDPYVAVRNAYAQYRYKQIKAVTNPAPTPSEEKPAQNR
jgi:phospholipid-binding lipoprotein MlaA